VVTRQCGALIVYGGFNTSAMSAVAAAEYCDTEQRGTVRRLMSYASSASQGRKMQRPRLPCSAEPRELKLRYLCNDRAAVVTLSGAPVGRLYVQILAHTRNCRKSPSSHHAAVDL
jgi:hypothetical protein